MNRTLAAALLALAIPLPQADAAPPRELAHRSVESGGDAPRRGRRPPRVANMPEAALSPTSDEVGDGDSFGRNVKFLGYAQTYGVSIQHDCTGWEPGTCAVTDGTSSVSIQHFDDGAVVRLPARAARSLLCFHTTPFGFLNFHNTSATRQNASGTMMVRWRIESEVLEDPALINQNTGQPFNGAIESGSFLAFEAFTIEPGAQRAVSVDQSRTCNSGNLRRQSLIGMGLTEEQAREVFRRPITLRFGSSLSVSWGGGGVSPGVRIYGD